VYGDHCVMSSTAATPIATHHHPTQSVNGLVFAGGLTWLWLDSPYVITARKLFNWAVEENDKGNPFPVS